jgi:amino acid adenylation domain-containing protein
MIYDYLRARSEQTPHHRAVVLDGESLTYAELEQKSNRLADALISLGLLPADRVALFMDKTPMAVTAMLGVAKAGGVYVPIDIQNPPGRCSHIVKAANPTFVISDEKGIDLYGSLTESISNLRSIPWIYLSSVEQPVDRLSGPAFQLSDLESFQDISHAAVRNENSLLHILFTSGSTGLPKGVSITHKNVKAFLDWAVPYFEMGPDDRTSCHSPLHFDLSTFDIYGSIAAGSTLFLIPSFLSVMPAQISKFMQQNELTQWFSVPSVLSYMARNNAIPEAGFPSLKRLIWCGEVFSAEDLRVWMQALPKVSFTNLYGPTEATIASSYYRVESVEETLNEIPIGKACTGEELLILDEHLNEVADGVQGDLYISGVGLSPGYWRARAKSESSFLNLRVADGGVKRVYKTGDRASRRRDGEILFHGRADYQIKSRGYRIELGEIESALADLPVLKEFAVVPVQKGGFEGTTIGCAYVAHSQGCVTPAVLKTHLQKKVPSYMIPQFWEEHIILPRNGNGKIDRRNLSDQFEIRLQKSKKINS